MDVCLVVCVCVNDCQSVDYGSKKRSKTQFSHWDHVFTRAANGYSSVHRRVDLG